MLNSNETHPFDMTTGQQTKTLKYPSGAHEDSSVLDFSFSPNGLRLAVGPSFDPPSTDYQVEIWEPTGDTWTRQGVLVDAKPGFAFSPDGTLLATLSGVDYTASITNPGPPLKEWSTMILATDLPY